MKLYSDDDIEVLGVQNSENFVPKRRRRNVWIYLWILPLVVVVAVASLIWLLIPSKADEEPVDLPVVEETEILAEIPENSEAEPTIPTELTDSINDVTFTIVNLDGYKASVSFEMPADSAENVILAIEAADTRADNGKIVGEFIHGGEQFTRGTRKSGYCYVSPDGNIAIGVGSGESHKQAALTDGGSFFRQYALVMDGEICPNVLKGKAKRRALGFIEGKPAFVMSHERESIYDFSQALADYGFSHAIYLPGGDGVIKMSTDKQNIYKYKEDVKARSPYVNYLIFTK